MDYQQLPAQLSRKSDRRALPVFISMILRQSAISLLIDRVVIAKVRNGRHRFARAVEIRITEHRVQSRRATTTPTPDSYARGIDKGPFDDCLDGVCLIL